MWTAVSVIFFALLGVFLGYFFGVILFCQVLNGGNLCGLPAFFIAAPLGGIIGGIVGWRSRR